MPVVSITLVCWIYLKNPAYDTYCTGTINKEKDGQAERPSPFHHDSKFASNSAGCTMPVNSSLLFARPWNTVVLLHSSHHIVSEHQTGGTLKAEEHWKARKSSGLCMKVSVWRYSHKRHTFPVTTAPTRQFERIQCMAMLTSISSAHS